MILQILFLCCIFCDQISAQLAASNACPAEGWWLAGDVCYFVSPERMNWYRAQDVSLKFQHKMFYKLCSAAKVAALGSIIYA